MATRQTPARFSEFRDANLMIKAVIEDPHCIEKGHVVAIYWYNEKRWYIGVITDVVTDASSNSSKVAKYKVECTPAGNNSPFTVNLSTKNYGSRERQGAWVLHPEWDLGDAEVAPASKAQVGSPSQWTF